MEVIAETEDIRQSYETEETLRCEHCGEEWFFEPHLDEPICTHCGQKTEKDIVAEQITEYPKWVWDGSKTIEHMAAQLEAKAEVLRELDAKGFALTREPIRGGHAYLERRTD